MQRLDVISRGRLLPGFGIGWSPEEYQAAGAPFRRRGGQASNAYVTRLHVRYDAQSFPEDLAFTETKDRTNFQGRYVLRYPFTGKMACDRGEQYAATLPVRFGQEARNLATLTGWKQSDIEARMEAAGQSVKGK